MKGGECPCDVESDPDKHERLLAVEFNGYHHLAAHPVIKFHGLGDRCAPYGIPDGVWSFLVQKISWRST